jgi:hypothetical protein
MRRCGFPACFSPILATAMGLVLVLGCGSEPEEVLHSFPLDSTEEVRCVRVELDTDQSSDGNGSLRMEAFQTTSFPLLLLEDVDVEDAQLIYRAKLRTEGVEGKVYLEMWCGFEGMGEFFSRALHAPLTGTTDWTTQETPFFLKPGQNPNRVVLNLVVEGKGLVWIDDIELARAPLS